MTENCLQYTYCVAVWQLSRPIMIENTDTDMKTHINSFKTHAKSNVEHLCAIRSMFSDSVSHPLNDENV